MSTVQYETEDGRVWELEYELEPFIRGTYWDPPEGGFVMIEGEVVEHLGYGVMGAPERLSVAEWRARYDFDDAAFALVEDEVYQKVIDGED